MTLLGNRVFAVVIKVRVEMRSSWVRVGAKSKESILIRARKGKMENTGEDPVKTEAEIRVMLPEALKSQDHQKAGEARTGPLLGPRRECSSCAPHCETIHFRCFQPPRLW